MGFDILNNLKDYSRYLAQYYPQSEVLRIGLDKLYYHENSQGREITNTELLGLLAYNRAYLAKEKKQYQMAYEYVLLAQMFNRDSRSNVDFEIALYYMWGSKLFSRHKYLDAFAVFADGYYRYPQNDDFENNTLAAFYRSMKSTWKNKNWSETARLIKEIRVLDILRNPDCRNIMRILKNWQLYFNAEKISRYDDQVARLMELLDEC
jgi:hypothetical protein